MNALSGLQDRANSIYCMSHVGLISVAHQAVLRLPALLIPGLNLALRLLFCRLRWHARSAWFTALTNIFGVAMAFFFWFTRGFSFSLAFFFSARLASTFFDGLPVCFSLGARVFGRNSSITRCFNYPACFPFSCYNSSGLRLLSFFFHQTFMLCFQAAVSQMLGPLDLPRRSARFSPACAYLSAPIRARNARSIG